MCAFTITAELPAMIWAHYVVAFDPAFAKGSSPMDTNITQYVCVAFGIAEGNQLLAQYFGSMWFVGNDVFALGDGIPEIDIHDRVSRQIIFYVSNYAPAWFVPVRLKQRYYPVRR
jgi:hypothetical protein